MTDIIGKKWWFFIFSLVIIIPGIVSLVIWGIKPSIDFTGGTLIEFKKEGGALVSSEDIKKTIDNTGLEFGSIQTSGENGYLLRMKPLDKSQSEKLESELKNSLGNIVISRAETIGPVVGQETAQNAIKAVFMASLAIVIYIALAFRKIPKPYSSFRFGICAVVALLHDVLVIFGLFSIFGHFFKVEIDSLFITAVLTIMGFSVHDTIVVFDRIRENMNRMAGKNFAYIVNESLLQTLVRSLSTSLTVLFTLFSMFLFGGETIKWFVITLLIGIISGTYSSVFNAAPLLVLWEEKINRKK